jgi:hypothetical protein
LDCRMHSTGLLSAAVANNASWCDAVCRSHGYPGVFSSRLWSSPRHRLQLYPNAITLRPRATEAEALAAAKPSGPFAVKDSFARLNLVPAGFGLLSEASWIARDGEPGGLADDGQSWDEVTETEGLGDWETAWADGSGDGPVFLSSLLSDPGCTILACRREGAIIAGAIVFAADGAAGISNVFSAGLPPDRLWADVRQAAAGLHPRLPVVGYEKGSNLEIVGAGRLPRPGHTPHLDTIEVNAGSRRQPAPGRLPQGSCRPRRRAGSWGCCGRCRPR